MNFPAFSYNSHKLRTHQAKVVDAVVNNLNTSTTHVIAFCTGGGKTHTARTIITRLLDTKRCLVLTHNQTILRDNFSEGFADDKVVIAYEGKEDIAKAANARVVIAIPSGSWKHIAQMGTFDYIIIDEAHQYIGSDCSMYKNIQAHLGDIPKILLTASHYGFQDPSFTKHLYSREEALADGVISDVEIHLIRTDWHPRSNQFDSNENLRSKYTIPKVYGIEVCKEIALRIKKDDYIKKSMIACHNVKTAHRMFEYFNALFPNKVSLSTAENDTEAKAFKDFQENDNHRIIVVVNRGIIGFDCPELECLFDLTLTKNVARVEQLLGRLLRVADVSKVYYRIAPTVDLLNHSIVMNSVLALSINSNNHQYDGSKASLKIIFHPENKAAILAEQDAAKARIQARMLEDAELDEGSETDYAGAGQLAQIEDGKVLNFKSPPIMKATEYVDKFNKALNGGSDVWALEGFTTLSEALGGKKPDYYWTYEKCLEVAKTVSGVNEICKKYNSAYAIMSLNNWLDKIYEDAGWDKSKRKLSRTYEDCLEVAKTVSGVGKLREKCPGAYGTIRRNNWIDKIYEEAGWDKSKRLTNNWTYENCLEVAKTVSGAKELKKKYSGADYAVRYNNWLDKIYEEAGWDKSKRKKKH